MPSDLGGGSIGQAALSSPFAPTPFIEDESKADRRRRKDAERQLETRLLDPWERTARYRITSLICSTSPSLPIARHDLRCSFSVR